MPYTPLSVEKFGGLDVMDDPQEIGLANAVALLNVDFAQPGRIRTRDGYALLSTSATAAAITGLAYYKDRLGNESIVVTDGTTLYPFDLSSGVVGTTSAITVLGGNNSFARFGTPGSTRLYVATQSAIFRYEDTTWTNTGHNLTNANAYLAVTPNDNRLVVAGNSLAHISGGDPNPNGETVFFSDAGDPETFGANNSVGLWPGDGEPITALARWRDLLFAFKLSKFAAFTGISTKPDGSPLFNYHGVDAGQGANPGAVVAGDDGLYFANNSGVYMTTGGPPIYLSRPLEPWIRAGAFTGLPSLSMANLTLAYFARVLYVTDRTNRTTLVYDTVRQAWSVWQLGATAAFAVPPSASTGGGLYFGDTSTKKVARQSSASTSDNGAAIAWSYQSGYAAPAGDKRIKLRGSSVWGTGTVTLQTLAQGARSADVADPGGAITLGVSPTVAEGKRRRSCRGVLFAHKLSGTGPASVSRITHRFLPPGLDS